MSGEPEEEMPSRTQALIDLERELDGVHTHGDFADFMESLSFQCGGGALMAQSPAEIFFGIASVLENFEEFCTRHYPSDAPPERLDWSCLARVIYEGARRRERRSMN